jgi:hypothetical protein
MNESLQLMIEKTRGRAGSNQHLAYEIQSALNPVLIFGFLTPSEEDRQSAIARQAEAFTDYDMAFLRNLVDGLEALKENNLFAARDPQFSLYRAYDFISRKSAAFPRKNEVIELTLRVWAIARLSGRLPVLPLPNYSPESEKKIQREIESLPQQKWSRHFEALRLSFRPAKRGPKPRSKTPR